MRKDLNPLDLITEGFKSQLFWVQTWIDPPTPLGPDTERPKPFRSGHRRTQTPTNLGLDMDPTPLDPDMDPSPNSLGSPPDPTPNPPGFGHAPIPLGLATTQTPTTLGWDTDSAPFGLTTDPTHHPAPLGPSTDLSPITSWVQTLI